MARISLRARLTVFLLAAVIAGGAIVVATGSHADGTGTTGTTATTTAPATCATPHWVASFEAAPSDNGGVINLRPSFFLTGDLQTYRMIIAPHLAGSTIRLRLSNHFGDQPITFQAVTVARQASGASIVAGTNATVTFSGQDSVTVNPGEDVTSDPLSFTVAPFQNLAVSIYLQRQPSLPTEHFTARQVSYATTPYGGDHTGDVSGSAFGQTTTSLVYVRELDVQAPATTGAVVAFGDSITDGYQATKNGFEVGSTDDENARYPDDLERRVAAAGLPLDVVSAAISGNRILRNGLDPMFGPSGLSRFSADVLAVPGVTTVIIEDGINDVDAAASAGQVEDGLTQLINMAHAAHLRVLLGTLTPVTAYQGTANGASEEQVREQVNAWIRSQTLADGVIDFDKAVQDPSDPTQIRPSYDGGDGLHLNPAGYQAMASAVPLSGLALNACATAAAKPSKPAKPAHKRRHHKRKKPRHSS